MKLYLYRVTFTACSPISDIPARISCAFNPIVAADEQEAYYLTMDLCRVLGLKVSRDTVDIQLISAPQPEPLAIIGQGSAAREILP